MVLERRARLSTRVRRKLARAVFEARQDLAYRPRLPGHNLGRPNRGRHGLTRRAAGSRRTVPFIAVLLVCVLAADVLALGELTSDAANPDVTAAVSQRRAGHGYVAAARQDRAGTAPGTAPDTTAGPAAGSPQSPAAQVAPLERLIRPHLFVVAEQPLPAELVEKVRRVKGVADAEVTGAADVTVDGKRVQTMGVDPSTFRAYTPKVTAGTDGLWRNIAAGDMAVSFELGHDGGVKLGSVVEGGGRRLRIGAYATVGMGSIAAIVSKDTAAALGVPDGNALVVSAPKVDSARLRRSLLKILPKGSQVATINPVVVTPKGRTVWPSTAFMSADQLKVALEAAVGKLGRPYVWGAEGPDSFDCSGLVQWAYAQAGVKMPRVTYQQWVTGPQVPLSQAQPGDLLFWRNDPTNPGYISHVAIYWGNGKMLHAPHTGDVVKIANVYTKNLAGVVRVSPQVSARVR
ncbi:NlpC/P60 family protein [Microbispora cellulosiformans]|uniref:NlpC/P60 family protein n=1 Tax=Microbispora cellulosiformans TaxID=2614688 RepID=A0A5J5JVV1_9ACTN|nr:NlpC/P60 family protein [Microbispora cellulosiformans]